jgi:hypothetical protein
MSQIAETHRLLRPHRDPRHRSDHQRPSLHVCGAWTLNADRWGLS